VQTFDSDLDSLLRTLRVPERPAEYWERFPKQVRGRIFTGLRAETPISDDRARLWLWGAATAFTALILCVGFWARNRMVTAEPNYTKLYREIESMFPNQVRAIVMENGAVKLDLSEKPDVPSSLPLRVDICQNQQCRTYITFSGQRIRVDTESWDVLTDGDGHVLVVGRNLAWTSAEPNRRSGAYHIDAAPLETS
jgi:hypothetical protein